MTSQDFLRTYIDQRIILNYASNRQNIAGLTDEELLMFKNATAAGQSALSAMAETQIQYRINKRQKEIFDKQNKITDIQLDAANSTARATVLLTRATYGLLGASILQVIASFSQALISYLQLRHG